MGDSDVQAALIVVNYGSCALLEANLAPIGRDAPDLNVVVVDCWTDAEERESVRAAARTHGWTCVLLDTNVGFGAGVNRGAAAAIGGGAEVLIVLNPDATMDGGTARILADEAHRDPLALVAPVIRRSDGSLWTEGTDLYLDDGSMAGVRHRATHAGRPRMLWLSGACFAMSVALWRRVGGFDEDYFLYWEDVDLCRRIQHAGGTCRILPEATAVHDEGGTQGRAHGDSAKSEIYYYYNIRNRLLFARRHLARGARRRWLASTLPVSVGILLQGGRRQLVEGIAPWRALWRGVRDGRRGATGPMRQPVGCRPEGLGAHDVRVYHEIRSAHLERAHEYAPAVIVYQTQRYDFDATLARGLELARRTPVAAALLIRRSRPRTLEVNEPLMLHGAILSALAVLAVRAGRRHRTRIVTYAIENSDTFRHLHVGWKPRLKVAVQKAAARFVWSQLDAIAYGTEGAQDLYRARFRSRPRLQHRLFPALPKPRDDVDRGPRGTTVVFLGAFVPRKGFPLLVDAWPTVVSRVPEATLTVIGKGALIDDAQNMARMNDSVRLLVDPPRAEIRDVLAHSHVLVLPSQRTAHWREQVGLPIVEGLESGCTIVTTAETGLATWLDTHGHRVLSAPTDATSLAHAIVEELARPVRAGAVLDSLPDSDGRQEADRWMFAGSAASVQDHAAR